MSFSRDTFNAARLRLALRSRLGTDTPNEVLATRTLTTEDGMKLLDRVRRQKKGWSDAERGAWAIALKKSIDWSRKVPSNQDLDLRRYERSNGMVSMNLIDRDVEDAQDRDLQTWIHRAQIRLYERGALRRLWKRLALPRWFVVLYIILMVTAWIVLMPWVLRPLPMADYARAGAIAQRMFGLLFGILLAPVALVWRFFTYVTLVRRTRPIPRSAF